MAEVINYKDIRKPNLKERTFKVTLTALALAMEYYLRVEPDPAFVQEARTSLFRHNSKMVCLVSERVYTRVTKNMPATEAVDQLLFG